MKYISSLVISVLLITACQQEEQKSKPVEPAKATEQKQEEAAAPVKKVDGKAIPNKLTPNPQPEVHSEHQDHNHDNSHTHAIPKAPLVLQGKKYDVVEPQMACEKPVVMEFFAYHCPHCNDLEPAAEAWRAKNADKIEFLSVPTDLGHKQLGSLLLVHHAAKLLGVLDKTQHALFNRYHNEKKLFASADEAAEFLAELGADLEAAKAMLANQTLMTESIQADFDLLNKYKITNVPQVLVNHQYMTNITYAGGHAEVFEAVDEMLKLDSSCKAK